MHVAHDFPPCFLKIHSNIIFPSRPRSSESFLLLRFSDQSFVRISHLSHACPRRRWDDIIIVVVVFQGLGLLALFQFRIYFLKLTNLIWTFGRTPWAGNQPDARPLPTQDNTIQKNADTLRPLDRTDIGTDGRITLK
jgi:hypothetical protein